MPMGVLIENNNKIWLSTIRAPQIVSLTAPSNDRSDDPTLCPLHVAYAACVFTVPGCYYWHCCELKMMSQGPGLTFPCDCYKGTAVSVSQNVIVSHLATQGLNDQQADDMVRWGINMLTRTLSSCADNWAILPVSEMKKSLNSAKLAMNGAQGFPAELQLPGEDTFYWSPYPLIPINLCKSSAITNKEAPYSLIAVKKDESAATSITESLEKSLIINLDEDAEMDDCENSPSMIPSNYSVAKGIIPTASPSTRLHTSNDSPISQSPSPASEAMNKLNAMDSN